MTNLNEVIREVYIDPIKSVLFIDDQFPTYKCMFDPSFNVNEVIEEYEEDISDFTDEQLQVASKTVVSKWENARISSLTASCRERGYIFDIENDPTETCYSFINKADLLVIDFVLERETGSGAKCIETLKELNNSKHFNLVIVYSTNSPSDILAEISESFNSVNMIHTKSESEDLFWIKGDNIFLTIIQKPASNPETIEVLINSLVGALCDYKPSAILMMLTKGINEFVSNKEAAVKKIFKSEIIRYAILYHIIDLDKTSPNEELHVARSISHLIERTFGQFYKGVHESVLIFGKKLLHDVIVSRESKKISAKKLEGISAEITDDDLFLALNSFLCCHDFNGDHFSNGTIFRCIDSHDDLWVCTSPSCDIVPRKPKEGKAKLNYREKLIPFNFIEAIRLSKVPKEQHGKCLKSAHNGRHIFVNYDGYEIYEVIDESSRYPDVEIFYMPQQGQLDEGKTSLFLFDMDGVALKQKEIKIEIIGQLFPEYADRILQQKGTFTTRIGVDFVSKK